MTVASVANEPTIAQWPGAFREPNSTYKRFERDSENGKLKMTEIVKSTVHLTLVKKLTMKRRAQQEDISKTRDIFREIL